jgi:hypothetical protein
MPFVKGEKKLGSNPMYKSEAAALKKKGFTAPIPRQEISKMREFIDRTGFGSSGMNAEIRARDDNQKAHARMTDKTMAEIKRRKSAGYAKGGSVASKRGDGCATQGKTKGKFV